MWERKNGYKAEQKKEEKTGTVYRMEKQSTAGTCRNEYRKT